MELRTNTESDRAVRTRVEELEEEVRQLRQLLLPVFVPPQSWELTAQESEVLRLLAMRPYVTPSLATTVLDIETKTLGILIYRLRKKIPEIEIKNERDRGYYLESWDKELILRKSSEWIKGHEIEVSDHMNLMRVVELIAKIDLEKLKRVVGLVHYVQKMLR